MRFKNCCSSSEAALMGVRAGKVPGATVFGHLKSSMDTALEEAHYTMSTRQHGASSVPPASARTVPGRCTSYRDLGTGQSLQVAATVQSASAQGTAGVAAGACTVPQ